MPLTFALANTQIQIQIEIETHRHTHTHKTHSDAQPAEQTNAQTVSQFKLHNQQDERASRQASHR